MKKPNVSKNALINLNTLEKEYSLEKCTIKLKRDGGTLKNSNYGITLIALVITVIVLLILARHQYFDVKPETTAYSQKL